MKLLFVRTLLSTTFAVWVLLPATAVVAQEAKAISAAEPSPQAASVRRVSLSSRELLDAPLVADDRPLDHALRWAEAGYEHIRADIYDYTCTMVKRERVDGRLSDYQYISAKVRNERQGTERSTPFSIYMRFLAPSDVQGREVLYVHGANDGKVIARKGGRRFDYIIVEVDPDSELAMRDNRYPITEFGIENLVARLIEVAREEAELNDCDVRYFRNAKVDGRACTGIEVTKREQRADSRYYRARIFIDNELQVPIHFESYDWPTNKGEAPLLLEQYTYRNLKLNVGLTDQDFDRNNTTYQLVKPDGK